jgi:hypothetical protein
MDGRVSVNCKPVRFASVKAALARVGYDCTGLEYLIRRRGTTSVSDLSSGSTEPLCYAANRRALRNALEAITDLDPARGDEIVIWLPPEPGDKLLFHEPMV